MKKASKGEGGSNSSPTVMDNILTRRKASPAKTVSAIERMKVLDDDFRQAIEQVEQHWLGESEAQLKKLLGHVLALTDKMIEKLDNPNVSVESMSAALNAFTRAMTTIAEQHNLSHGRPTSLNAHLHAHKITRPEALTDEQLDTRIKSLLEQLDYVAPDKP